MIRKKFIRFYSLLGKRVLNTYKFKFAIPSFKINESFSTKKRFYNLVDVEKKEKLKDISLKLKSSFKDEKTFFLQNNNMQKGQSKEFTVFFNQCFDKGRLKNFVLWFLAKYGENKTVYLVEHLKNIGFYYASKAGISLGIDDLKIPPKKAALIYDAEKLTSSTINQYLRGEITGVERFQRLIDTWHRTSEILKQEVIDHFEATDILNPVYMMAFSGARGNISQVRQLVGMRGLMADPQGQILDFPIRSNFREGLTLTEYIISSYGARKGIVDTALRTANAGYLTRRLVDVAQHVIISNFDCGTKRGIFLTNMKEGNKVIYSLHQRIVGRILARDVFISKKNISSSFLISTVAQENDKKYKIASRNEEVTPDLAFKISKNVDKVFVRSSLTCEKLICQLCYGWSLAQGKLVSIGEAVGVVAAQSIGEPGTQLTMRTFHTGGVFSGDISDQIKAPFDGVIEYISAIPGTLIRTPEGKIAFLTKSMGSFVVYKSNTYSFSKKEVEKTNGFCPFPPFPPVREGREGRDKGNLPKPEIFSSKDQSQVEKKQFKIPSYTLLYMRNGQNVYEKEVIAQISSISQKTNATDDAELTIKSDIEGQFYSKSVGFREKMIGPKLKKSNDLGFEKFTGFDEFDLQSSLQNNQENSQQDVNLLTNSSAFFQNLEYDKIYEAWDWGYAWILSGKIYEFKKPSILFPIIGDFVNTKSYITQTKWNLNNNPYNYKSYKDNSSIQVSPSINSILFEFNRRKPTNSQLELTSNYTLIDQSLRNLNKSYPLKTSQVLLFDLNNILYKKYGYVFELTKKSQFISLGLGLNKKTTVPSTRALFSIRETLDKDSKYYVSESRKDKEQEKKDSLDLLFFFKVPPVSNFNIKENFILLNKAKNPISLKNSFFNYKNKRKVFDLPKGTVFDETKDFIKPKILSSKSQKQDKTFSPSVIRTQKQQLVNNKRYLEPLPYILQWYLNTYNTKTPGIAIFEVPKLYFGETFSFLKKNITFFEKDSSLCTFPSLPSLPFGQGGKGGREKKPLVFSTLMKERLDYLKKREIETSKIFWIPFYVFKVSNLITYSKFMELYSDNSKDKQIRSLFSLFDCVPPFPPCPSGREGREGGEGNIQVILKKERQNINDLNLFMSYFLNKRINILQTNRQGNIFIRNNFFDNKKNNSPTNRLENIQAYRYKSFGSADNTFNNQTEISIVNTNFPLLKDYRGERNKAEEFFLNKNSEFWPLAFNLKHSYFKLEKTFGFFNLLKIKKSVLNKHNKIIYNSFFRKRLNVLTSLPALPALPARTGGQGGPEGTPEHKNKLEVYENLTYKKFYSFNKKLKFTTLKSFCKLVQSFTDFYSSENTKPNFTEKEKNPFSFLFSIFEENTNDSIISKNRYKEFLIQKNRSLFFLKSIHDINFYKNKPKENLKKFSPKNFKNILLLSNFLEKNYKEFNLIKNKTKFDYFLNIDLKMKPLSFRLSPLVEKIFGLNLRKLEKTKGSHVYNNFILRAKTNNFNILNSTFFIPPHQSFLITQSFFNESKIGNDFNKIKHPLKTLSVNTIAHTTLKKGWVFVTTSSLKKNSWDFINTSKKFIYSGKVLFNNITFSIPILVECLLLNPVFKIRNISSLCIKNLPDLDLINLNSNNGTQSSSFYKNKQFEDLSLTSEQSSNLIIKIFYDRNNTNNANNVTDINNVNKTDKYNEKYKTLYTLDRKNNFESTKLDPENNTSKNDLNIGININKLRWIKNEKSRFYIEENDYFCSDENSQINIFKKNRIKIENKDISIGFLLQPIQEFEQMSKVDIKKYVYESNKTTYNVSNVPLSLPFPALPYGREGREGEITKGYFNSKNKDYLTKKPNLYFPEYIKAINSILYSNFKNQEKFQAYSFTNKKNNEGKKGLKKFLISIKKYTFLKSNSNQDCYSNLLKPYKSIRDIFINHSFDSLSKKRLYKTTFYSKGIKPFAFDLKHSGLKFEKTNVIFPFPPFPPVREGWEGREGKDKGNSNNQPLLNLPFSQQKNKQDQFFTKIQKKSLAVNIKDNSYSSLIFMLTISNDLNKSIFIHSNLFTNKTFFKKSDWKIIGLLQNKTYYSHASSLSPKLPKDDFTIIPNILINNYMQQNKNIEYLKLSPFLSMPYYCQKFTSIFIVTRKSLNLFPFLITYKNLANFTTLFNKKKYFKLFYSPISNFDSILYPFLATEFKTILNQYLINSVIIKEKINFFQIKKNEIKGFEQIKKNKTFLYSDFYKLIHNTFELQCFDFLLTQSFNFSSINNNKNQVTEFLYNHNSFSIFSKTLDKTKIINKTQSNLLPRFLVNNDTNIKRKNKLPLITLAEAQTNFYSPFYGELIYTQKKPPFSSLSGTSENDPFTFGSGFQTNEKIITKTKNLKTSIIEFITRNKNDSAYNKSDFIQKKLTKKQKLNLDTSFDEIDHMSILNQYQLESLPTVPYSYGCMFLTKQNLISFYLPRVENNLKFRDFLNYGNHHNYEINHTLIKFLTISEVESFKLSSELTNYFFNTNDVNLNTTINIQKIIAGGAIIRASVFRKSNLSPLAFGLKKFSFKLEKSKDFFKFKKPFIVSNKGSISLLGDFYVYGDSISDLSTRQTAVQASGQIIHYSTKKITLRKAQPIFISPKGILHKYDGEFIDPKAPVITLSYKRLKTGDIIQGIPKVEQFFEARTTKRGRLFRDSLPSLLKALFKRYQSKMSLELAVRQSFYKIQQIMVDGVHRVYKAQGVTISDKHLEVIVKQMTSKVRILGGAQTGFFPGEVVDISFVEKINQFLIKKVTYEPLVLGITKASLEVDSFLSAASFQQTTKVLSQAALYKKKDFLKGLKENVILGNLIPAGTGYLVYLDDLSTN